MIMITLPDGDVRTLMNILLVQQVFDVFELRSCTIQSFARFDIEGIPGDNPPEDGRRGAFCKWARIRPYVYNIIKGSEKPRFMKFVFSAPEELLTGFTDAQALFINIIFDKNLVHITTGVSAKSWSPDKGTENQWDGYVVNFIKKNNLTTEE